MASARHQEPPRSRRPRAAGWLALVAAALLAVTVATLSISGCAGFGAAPEGEGLWRAQRSSQWHDGAFTNPQPIWADKVAAWRDLLFSPARRQATPEAPVPVVHHDGSVYRHAPVGGLRLTWFGHASTLLEIDGTTVLIDPLWSERASPVPWAGPKRWYAPPVALRDLPPIDVVLISHDHFDHLDQATIAAMKPWRTVFVVPLGVGAHLARWGIPEHRIVELDWWQGARVKSLQLVATPARHASGRLLRQPGQTLWAGWAVVGPQHRVWYSGDTGFHKDLATIGERLGPFDLTLIEAGQYDAHWPDTHLGPEGAVEAHRQVRGKTLVPVHWGLIQLAPHAWTEPVERVIAAARCHGVPVLTPRPGEVVERLAPQRVEPWWPRLAWRRAGQYPLFATKNGSPGDRVGRPPCAGEGRGVAG